jgi:multiple sugar transport system substrate-binding protein
MLRRRVVLRAAGSACTLALAGCTRSADRSLRFWAMGREGEVVGELLAGFEREHPGLTVRVEQLPWTAAHEKLLTAFAGDATPDVAQLGNTWIAELAALGALEPLEPWLDGDRSIVASTTSMASGAPTRSTARCSVCLGMLTRDCCSTGVTCSNAPAREMPDTWAGFTRALEALQRSGTPHPLLLPVNEFERCWPSHCRRRSAASRRRTLDNFRSAGFRRALDFYMARFAAARHRQSRVETSPTCGKSSAAALSPPSSPVPGTSASSTAVCPRHCATAGARRHCPGRTAPAHRPPAAPAW